MTQETITDVSPSGNVATHEAGIHTLAGSTFWALLFSFFLFLIGFSTMGWQNYYMNVDGSNTISVGLWANCLCQGGHVHEGEAWFKASRAMFTLALMSMIAALVMLLVYMYVQRVRKGIAIVVASTLCFVSFLFLFVGVCVFGVKTGQPGNGSGHQSYSFVLTVISMIFTLMAGVLSVYHMRLIGMFGSQN